MADTSIMLLLEFAGLFLFILILGYIFPAGQFYYQYHVRKKPSNEARRIQHRQISRDQIWREVRMSVVTVAIFAAMGTGLLELYKASLTNIYWRFRDYPLYYLPISFLLCLVAHDTFFYWSHRFMHWKPVFKYTHVGHHRSISPTPWAIYAFQPLEAVIQGIGMMLIIALLPMHPVVLLAFLWYDTIVNTAGHTGYEVVPRAVARSWFYRGFNTVTHHDAHHTNMRVNFGSFFNIWDRLMGTFEDATIQERAETAPNSVPAPMSARQRSPADRLPSRKAG